MYIPSQTIEMRKDGRFTDNQLDVLGRRRQVLRGREGLLRDAESSFNAVFSGW
jgi:hypothetical protein